MPLAAIIRHQVESALANKVPSALTPAPRIIGPTQATGIEPLDLLLEGGFLASGDFSGGVQPAPDRNRNTHGEGIEEPVDEKRDRSGDEKTQYGRGKPNRRMRKHGIRAAAIGM